MRKPGLRTIGCAVMPLSLLFLLLGSLRAEEKLVTADTKFGFKLLAELNRADSTGNIFISPASIALALAMTGNGAAGTTREAMARTMELGEISLDSLNRSYQRLLGDLKKPDSQVRLSIANSLWARKDIQLSPEFLKLTGRFYGAKVTNLDFARSDAARKINDWVSRNTQRKVNYLIDRTNPNDLLYLINAIYFKGSWSQKFDSRRTARREFTLLNQTRESIPMMTQSGDYRYCRDDKFQAVSLPYGSGRISMYVFLPNVESDLAELLRGLIAENWDSWLPRFRRVKGDIVLPRFQLEYEATLNDALKELGMAEAFDPARADFSNLTRARIGAFISAVKHKAVVEVNEEGTEAAAATSVGVALTALPESFTMVVDRPFFFAIRDNQTGLVLFTGVVRDPT